MIRVAANKLLMGAIILVVGYWIVMPQLTGYSNALVSSFLIIAGIIVMGSWGPDALRALWSGILKGPQLALISVAGVALGSVIQGTFSFTWWWMGEPLHWLNTPMSGFGRYIMGCCFILQYLSEDIQISRYRKPKLWFVFFAVLMTLAFGIFIGYTWGENGLGNPISVRPI